MSSFSLPRTFDAITCLFGAVAYLQTSHRLRAAVERMAAHLTDAGVLIIEPWFTPSAFWPDHLDANFRDTPDLKLAWMYRHEHRGETAVLEYHFLVGEPHGIETFVERHELGLFSEADWDSAFSAAGLRGTFDPDGPFGRGLYTAVRA